MIRNIWNYIKEAHSARKKAEKEYGEFALKALVAIIITTIISTGIIIFSSYPAHAGSTDIIIWEPDPDGATIAQGNLSLSVDVNYPQVTTVKAAIKSQNIYYWVNLEQGDANTWTGVIDTASIPEGKAEVTAKYRAANETFFTYIDHTTPISIRHQQTVIIKGNAILTVLDYAGHTVQGVTVQPSGNQTNSVGVVTVGQQPLNQAINFSFYKVDYKTAYTTLTFTSDQIQSQTITLRKDKDDIKTLSVSGFSGYAEPGTMIYLKIKDAKTSEPIDGAKVMIFKGQAVQSIPGETKNGRITVSLTEPGDFEMTIEKAGYEEWSDTITVIAPRITPTPTPIPAPAPASTPAPTPEKIFRPDVGQSITNDEYRAWLADQEKKKREANAVNNTAPPVVASQPQDQSPSLLVIGVGVAAITGIGYTALKKKKRPDENQEATSEDIPSIISAANHAGGMPGTFSMQEMVTLKCPDNQCEWEMKIPAAECDENVKKAILDKHTETHNV